MAFPDPQAMAGPAVHAAKSRKRPLSRASTSSVHSVSTQPNMEQSFSGDDVYSTQWLKGSQSQHKEIAPAMQQMTPEDMILQAAAHAQSSGEYALDSSMNASASFLHANMSRQSFSADNSFADDSQMMDRDGHDDGDSVHGAVSGQKSSRSSANNELEMRQLFHANKHRRLPDVAEELHGNERGPQSERTRQIFAMLWYVEWRAWS
jgi:regulatory factor X, other